MAFTRNKVKPRQRSSWTTHRSLSFILIFGKWWAIFPLTGLRGRTFRYLHFSWTSAWTLYSFAMATANLVVISLQINHIARKSSRFDEYANLAFNFCGLITSILFINLARTWPGLMERWHEIDRRMMSYTSSKSESLPRRLKLIAIAIGLSAIFEHGLSLSSGIYKIYRQTNGHNVMDTYLRNSCTLVSEYFTFSYWIPLSFEFVNVAVTVSWTYKDLFIMLISNVISIRFEQINCRLKEAVNSKERDVTFWRRIRMDYTVLCELCNHVDESISDITLISFANNLFVVLVQLFNSLSSGDDVLIDKVYFQFSFGFLIARILCVSLWAAEVSAESQRPTFLLLSTPTEIYNIEIERFLYKVQTDPCALTGKKLFRVTKSIILDVERFLYKVQNDPAF